MDELEQSLRTRARPAPMPAELRQRILADAESDRPEVAARSLKLWRAAALAAACIGAMATLGGTWAGYTHGRSAAEPFALAQVPQDQPPALRPAAHTPSSAGTLMRAALHGDIQTALDHAASALPAPGGTGDEARPSQRWFEGL